MRKALPALLLALALLCLSACGAQASQTGESPAPAPVLPPPPAAEEAAPSPLVISEVMARNHSTLPGPDGSFPDWIELFNASDEPVELEGLILADREKPERGSPLPRRRLLPGEYVLVFADGRLGSAEEPHVDFSLSDGESVFLFSPEGRVLDRLDLDRTEADCSYIRREGAVVRTAFPSPGYENGPAGYDAFQDARVCSSPLQIWEVSVSDRGPYFQETEPHSDWVELLNTGDAPLSTEGWALSDDRDQPEKYPLPPRILQPGERMLILCTEESVWNYPLSGFALNAARESLYLSHEGQLADYVSLHDIPCRASFGRAPGENGFFYYTASSFSAPNTGPRARRVSEPPAADGPDGVFDGVGSLTVRLSGGGQLYYTLDGSLPTEESTPYTGPLTIEKTCVLRAVAVQEGALPSPALDLSYILNEGHSLPVISLMGDDPAAVSKMINTGRTFVEHPGAVCLYEDGQRVFGLGCGLSVSGLTSPAAFPKRSIRVDLRGAYGAEELGCDLFGEGSAALDSFILRAGQDSAYRMMNSEIWQELCLEMSGRVLTQHSKYCVVYLNGEYYGIYILKENISPGLYARWAGVSRKSVLSTVPHISDTDDYLAMYHFISEQDMGVEENYRRACELLDTDSFIDWVILEGVSGNYDLFRNVRFFRSTESDRGYQLALFDLDNSLRDDGTTWHILFYRKDKEGFFNSNASRILLSLLDNPDFRERFLRRYAQVYSSVLSNDSVIRRIEECEALIRPELARDRARWGYSAEDWEKNIRHLKAMIRERDWQNYCVRQLDLYLDLTEAEWAYFR